MFLQHMITTKTKLLYLYSCCKQLHIFVHLNDVLLVDAGLVANSSEVKAAVFVPGKQEETNLNEVAPVDNQQYVQVLCL